MSDLETRAWAAEPPQGGEPHPPEEIFSRTAFAWVGTWLGRAKKNLRYSEARPFVILMTEGIAMSPQLDSHLVGKEAEVTTLFTHDCPMPFDVIVATPNLRRAYGYRVNFSVASDVVRYMKQNALESRHALIVDPLSLAYGYSNPANDIDQFETITPDLAPVPPLLSTEVVDEHLTKFYEKFVRLPDKPYGVKFWENRDQFQCISGAEFEIQRAMLQYFIVLLNDDRHVATDSEIQMPSGRADVRLLAAGADGFRAYFMELKVLRERDGPSEREKNVRECIAQARGRRGDASLSTEAAFACCYDASKEKKPPGEALQGLADEDPRVMLRHYPVLSERYVVSGP